MTRRAIIIHGWGADSQSNWFPWLKKELETCGWQVLAPDFPNSQNPILVEWLKFFDQIAQVDENTILIGHSLGVAFILRLLERLPKHKRVQAAYLVSGFAQSLGILEISNFFEKLFNWEKIKRSGQKFIVINSDNDPYVPLGVGRDLAENLGTRLIVEPGGGHLNTPHGFLSYPRLLQIIINADQ